MSLAADTPPDTEPQLRLVVDPIRTGLRFAGLGLGFFVVAAGCGASWSLAALLAAGVLLAMFVEHAVLRTGVGRKWHVANRAARTEGQRDAVAQVVSLELAYERMRSVLEALGEGVLVVDKSGLIVLANSCARHLMEAPVEESVGCLLWQALTPALAVPAREAWQSLQEPRADDDERPRIRYMGVQCGDCVYDMTAAEVMSRRTGQDFGTAFLLVDSTRTHELQRIKDRFLSSVSHELRTPLTNICAYSEILRHMLPGESMEWPEFVKVIHEEGMQLSRLVDTMFDCLQLESGEAAFHNEVIDGGEIVRTTVQMSLGQATSRAIQLDLQTTGEPPPLVADAKRLEQVVCHLVDNAIKFSPDGGRVLVSVASCEEGWQLRVDDNGPGVPLGDRQAVFEKFNQLRDHLTEKPAGTGIGLAASRAIVTNFGGLVWCEDSPFGGARFVVLLPGQGQPRLSSLGTAVVPLREAAPLPAHPCG